MSDNDKKPLNPMGEGYTLAIHFVLSILIMAGIGLWLDDVFGTKPWLMLVFLVLGFASGLLKVYQSMNRDD